MKNAEDSNERRGRNELCTGCGNKVKRCACARSRSSYIIVALTTLVLAILGVGLAVSSGIDTDTDPLRAKTTNTSGFEAYAAERKKDRWLLTGEEDPETWIAVTDGQRRRIEELLRRYAEATPFAAEIVRTCSSFWLSSFQKGHSISHTHAKEGSDIPRGIELCFVPKNEEGSFHQTLCYYREDWKALMVLAIHIPDPFFASILFHELGHVVRHRERGEEKQSRDACIDEENEMHEFETVILDAASSGRFSARVRAIVERFPENTEITALLRAVTSEELRSLDDILTKEPLSARAASLASGHYAFAIGFCAIERNGGGIREKRNLYAALSRK